MNKRGSTSRRAWLYRLVPYLGRRAAEQDLDEELRLHLEFERERNRDAGLSEDAASRAARRKLGNATLIRERTRDVWGWRWLDDLGRDVRHAARGLRRSPGSAATVVLVLALGIGANTAMFSIVHGLLIRPLPYPEADAIVRVGHVSAASWPAQVLVSNTRSRRPAPTSNTKASATCATANVTHPDLGAVGDRGWRRAGPARCRRIEPRAGEFPLRRCHR